MSTSPMTGPLSDPARELCLATPPDLPMYAENFMLAAHDPVAGIGAWLHLGTWPEDFGLWEDILLLSLPDGDVLTMTGYRRTPVAERPGGSLLAFRCLEPFARWQVTFDGLATRTPRKELDAGLVHDGPRERVRLELDVRCVTDVWDAASSSSGSGGRGSMTEQVWASDHYQQLLQITGEITVAGATVPLSATGVRDHSRGQRGHAMEKWGGHTLIHLLFPSGRTVGVQRMYDPSGEPNFDMAYVRDGGVWQDAEIVEAPRIATLADVEQPLRLVVRTADAEHVLTGELVSSWPLTPHRLGMGVGTDLSGPHGIMVVGHARWTWDGEESTGLTERSFGTAPSGAGSEAGR